MVLANASAVEGIGAQSIALRDPNGDSFARKPFVRSNAPREPTCTYAASHAQGLRCRDEVSISEYSLIFGRLADFKSAIHQFTKLRYEAATELADDLTL